MPREHETSPGPAVIGSVAHARSAATQILFGVLVIVFGALFTLDNLGIVEAGQILRFWPVVPLVYGVFRLTGLYRCQNTTAGLIFTLGGGLLLLHEVHLIALDPWEMWPVVLIAVGISMVSKAFRHRHGEGAAPLAPAAPGPPTPYFPGSRRMDDSTTFSVFAVWGHTLRVVSGVFRRGDATAILAGHDIDLRGARIEGPSATLDVFSWWGSINLIVPQNWRIVVEVVPLMGTVEDSSWAPAGEVAGTLMVRGSVVMGNLTIKN
jgi:predicted membrane protein